MNRVPPPITPPRNKLSQLIHKVGPFISAVLFIAAAFLLYHELKSHSLSEILDHLESIPQSRLIWSLILTFFGYLGLTGYDWLAFRYISHSLPYRRIAYASFVGYAFSNAMGHPLLSGGSIRFRMYSMWGLTPGQITAVILFGVVSFKIGMVVLAGAVMLYEPTEIAWITHIHRPIIITVGVLLVVLSVLYLWWTMWRREPVRVGSVLVRVPSLPISLGQVVVTWVDMALAGAVLYVTVPQTPSLGFIAFMAIFLTAYLGGMLSMIPGGLGVFEAIMLKMLEPHFDGPTVIGFLLVYRVVYYLIPFIIGLVMLAVHEYRLRGRVLPHTHTH